MSCGDVSAEKDRRDAVFIGIYAGGNPACAGQCDHAALVGADQRSLRSGQWDVENSLGMSAVNQERPGDSQWHLDRAHGILNVSPHLFAGN